MQDTITIHGTHGDAVIKTSPSGARLLELSIHGQETRTVESIYVDLEAAKAADLEDAARKACETGHLPLFEKTHIAGSKALVVSYHRANEPSYGYATIVKKGVKPLRFAFSRINLPAMKSASVREALRKVAFETGAVRLLNPAPAKHAATS